LESGAQDWVAMPGVVVGWYSVEANVAASSEAFVGMDHFMA